MANTGAWIGLEILKNCGRVASTEKSAATGAVTNEFSDSADPFGGGFVLGYKFAPWASNLSVQRTAGRLPAADLPQIASRRFSPRSFVGSRRKSDVGAHVPSPSC